MDGYFCFCLFLLFSLLCLQNLTCLLLINLQQATIKEPVVSNMMKALYFQFTAGVLPMYAVTFIGYWAYGSSTSTYLLSSVNGPVWVKGLANISAFLQTVIALHVNDSRLVLSENLHLFLTAALTYICFL
jgi:hypothetical protein